MPGSVLERWNATRVAYIALVAVDAPYRNRGIGFSLLSQLLHEFEKAGADTVLLDCPAEAKEARKIFDKLGFETRAVYMARHTKRKIIPY